MTTNDTDVNQGHDCPTCSKTLSTELGLKQHHAKVHNESLVETTDCEVCGDEIKVRPSDDERYTCSWECKNIRRTGRDMPARSRRVTLTCKGCGDEFDVPKSDAEDGKKYCSQECYDNDSRAEYIECEQCGDEFYAHGKRVDEARFCGQDCYGEWLSENKSGQNSPHWRGEDRVTDDNYGPGWGERKRDIVRERDGYECQDCGMAQEDHIDEYDMQLHVHHIIRAREATQPAVYNAPRNLVSLCVPCHMRRDRSGNPDSIVMESN